jgi:cell wall-associated NlpC family hydrolase
MCVYDVCMETHLPDNQQQQLRQRGVISSDEVAIRVGDLVIAENVISRSRRVVNSDQLTEDMRPRRVLRD